jgi:hypothetical protein
LSGAAAGSCVACNADSDCQSKVLACRGSVCVPIEVDAGGGADGAADASAPSPDASADASTNDDAAHGSTNAPAPADSGGCAVGRSRFGSATTGALLLLAWMFASALRLRSDIR